MRDLLNSKFFGQPNGTKPPAKQSKLSFSSKPSVTHPPSSASSKENEDVDMKDEDPEVEVKPKVEKKEDVDTKVEAQSKKGMESATLDRIMLTGLV